MDAKNIKTSSAITIAAGAAGSSNLNGSTLDMEGFEDVLIALQTGPIVSGSVASLKLQQGAQSDASDMSDLLGTAQTIADTDDNKEFLVNLIKPVKRYVRLVVLIATQNATVAALYHQSGARKTPVTQGANVSMETHISPAEGTA